MRLESIAFCKCERDSLKVIFRCNFSLLPQGFNVGALMPQGEAGNPNYYGFLNNYNLVTLINCESLIEMGEMACVTPARSSRGNTIKIKGRTREGQWQ